MFFLRPNFDRGWYLIVDVMCASAAGVCGAVSVVAESWLLVKRCVRHCIFFPRCSCTWPRLGSAIDGRRYRVWLNLRVVGALMLEVRAVLIKA